MIDEPNIEDHLSALDAPRAPKAKRAPAPPQEAGKATRVTKLVELLGEMSDEEVQEASQKIGADLPLVPKGINPDVVTWAYKCMHCPTLDTPFNYAFEFTGDKFALPDGNVSDRPPLNVPIERIPWTQNKGTRKSFSRSAPVCQHCGNPVHLLNGCIADTRMIDVQRDQRERAILQEQMRKPRHRRQVAYNSVRGGSTGDA